MSIAVYVKTESSDDYLYNFDCEPNEVVEKLMDSLGGEFAYVFRVIVSFVEKDYSKQEKLENVIMNHVEKEQERLSIG